MHDGVNTFHYSNICHSLQFSPYVLGTDYKFLWYNFYCCIYNFFVLIRYKLNARTQASTFRCAISKLRIYREKMYVYSTIILIREYFLLLSWRNEKNDCLNKDNLTKQVRRRQYENDVSILVVSYRWMHFVVYKKSESYLCHLNMWNFFVDHFPHYFLSIFSPEWTSDD